MNSILEFSDSLHNHMDDQQFLGSFGAAYHVFFTNQKNIWSATEPEEAREELEDTNLCAIFSSIMCCEPWYIV